MILGFAHITRNIVGHYRGTDGIPSAPEKWPLMLRQATAHRLFMRDNDDWFPTEIVEYDTGVDEQKSRLTAALDCIQLSARDTHAEVCFFRDALGFDINAQGWIQRTTVVPQWDVRLRVEIDAEAPIDPPLDIAGYAALAFYSSDVEADRDHLLKHGGRTPTEPFTVKLDREMKIVMLRSPEGTIIELIQVLK